MLDFTYCNPTKIIFGKGRIAEIAGEIPENARVMVIYGGGSIQRNGVMRQIQTALAGRQWSEFGGIEPNPTFETACQCVQRVKAEGFNFLLAVGGGSVVDATKLIAAAACYEGDLWEIMTTRGAHVKQALPFGVVLTLSATGSEMNRISVITNRALQDKRAFESPLVYPRFSVLDPAVTYSLPTTQVGNGVVDTFIHVMEQYMTYPVQGKVQDRQAEGILLTLIEEGPKALREPENYDVRANLMWCATLGLNGLLGVGVPQDWSTHLIGHELTALHGLDHAKTLAVILPAMLQVRKKEKWEKLLQYAERVWLIREGDEEARIDAAIEKTRAFFESMQIKTRLRDYNIPAESIGLMVAQLEKHGNVKLGERKNVTPEVARQVLELSL